MARTRALGGVQKPMLIGIGAAVIVGGTALFVIGKEPAEAKAQDPKFRAAAQVETPAAEPAAEIPRVAEDADKIMKGELIKYRDENGTVRYRSRELFKGTTADGRETLWRAEAFLGPQPKKLSMAEYKSKIVRKPLTLSPPKFQLQNGKLISGGKASATTSDETTTGGSGGGGTGPKGGSSGSVGGK